LREKYSGLLLQKRLLNEDDIDIHTSAREFVPLETLDQTITHQGGIKAFFTVGVVIEVSGPIKAKTGKEFSIMKLSDLVKYDISKARLVIQKKYEATKAAFGDEAAHVVKLQEKNFNSNGYKTIKFMGF
jgi:hypothetical protein